MATFAQNYRAGRGLMTAVIVLIVLIAGIVALVEFIAHSTAGYTVSDISQLGAHVCDGGQKIKNAGAYKGNPPHKMSIVEESSVIQTKPNLTDYNSVDSLTPPIMLKTNPALASKIYKFQQAIAGENVSDIQLVACISRTNEKDTGKICAYDTGNLHVYDTQYKLNVYVAKTHKLIKSATLKTTPVSQFACPSSVYYDPANNRQYLPYDELDLYNQVQPIAQA